MLPGGLGPHKWVDRDLVAGTEPLIVDLSGEVLESGRGNVFIVEGDTLVTPPADGRILPGVTRDQVLRLAEVAIEPIDLARMRGRRRGVRHERDPRKSALGRPARDGCCQPAGAPGTRPDVTHDPLLLAAFALWCFVVALAGGLAGLVLGNIRLPAALALASSPAAGAGANIGISAVAAAAGVDRPHPRRPGELAAVRLAASAVGGRRGGGRADLGRAVAERPAGRDRRGAPLLRDRPAAAEACAQASAAPGEPAITVAIGLGIGLLGGLVGLILGSLRMPAMIRWLGEPPARAMGTNLAVGFWVGIAGVLGHAPGGVDWGLLGIGAAASIPGALLGARLTGRLSERRLLQAVGVHPGGRRHGHVDPSPGAGS